MDRSPRATHLLQKVATTPTGNAAEPEPQCHPTQSHRLVSLWNAKHRLRRTEIDGAARRSSDLLEGGHTGTQSPDDRYRVFPDCLRTPSGMNHSSPLGRTP